MPGRGITRPMPVYSKPRSLVISSAASVALTLSLSACSEHFEVDGARAHARVVHQVEAGPRIPGTRGHATVLAWLKSELSRLGARVEEQVIPDSSLGRPLELHNVIAHFGPASDRRIMLCAHWDSRPWCDEDSDSTYRNEPVPGANDGGSGVAVLLEVAELMSRRAPPSAVDLVFFDGEDLGNAGHPEQYSLGARAFARSFVGDHPQWKPTAAFLFDMVGDRTLDIYPEAQSRERAANLVDIVLDGARATSAIHFHPETRYTVIDDHVPLLEAGVPTVDIIDFDYPAWHTHRDLPGQVSPASLAEVSRVAAWIVYRSPLALSR